MNVHTRGDRLNAADGFTFVGAGPFLFALDPETAHDLAFASLDRAAQFGLARLFSPGAAATPVTVMGITFPNRVGLAAGLDKNAQHLAGLATFGFGFLEAGTVTPRPQPGNPKPRMSIAAGAGADQPTGVQ
jgi:dihydroorotate dehydrogenase